jgi:hypothetical protein
MLRDVHDENRLAVLLFSTGFPKREGLLDIGSGIQWQNYPLVRYS